ncbi:MAG: alkaline phosphatase family protein [Dehalococcoidia bacterium]
MLRPSAAHPNIVDLSRALARAAGVDQVAETAGVSSLIRQIGPASHLVFILADGLGMNLVERLPTSTFLGTQLAGELRTVFPSTSSVALTALATGVWPNQHGVTGQWTHLPEVEAAAGLLQFATRAGGRPLGNLGVSVRQAFPAPSVYSAMRRDVASYFPTSLVDSVSSAYFSGGRERVGYRSLPEAIDSIIGRVRCAAGPTYTYLYAPQIDLEAHYRGIGHATVAGAVMELDREVSRLAGALAGGGRIVLTADHGLLDTPITSRHYLRPSAGLFEALRFPPSGDSRVMYLHVREGATDRVRAWFHHHYGSRFLVLTRADAEGLELFGPGPLGPQTAARVGDLLILSTGTDVLEYVPGKVERLASVVSHHSGLTPAEMRVPLVIA